MRVKSSVNATRDDEAESEILFLFSLSSSSSFLSVSLSLSFCNQGSDLNNAEQKRFALQLSGVGSKWRAFENYRSLLTARCCSLAWGPTSKNSPPNEVTAEAGDGRPFRATTSSFLRLVSSPFRSSLAAFCWFLRHTAHETSSNQCVDLWNYHSACLSKGLTVACLFVFVIRRGQREEEESLADNIAQWREGGGRQEEGRLKIRISFLR